MAEKLHLGCGRDYKQGYVNVDNSTKVRTDRLVELDKFPWPFESNQYQEITATHLFEHLDGVERALRECARLLTADGTLKVTVPIGVNALADPDHKHRWTWHTPLFYCGHRHWDADVGLTVAERDITLWSTLPGFLGTLHRQTIRLRQRYYGPGEWCCSEPFAGGELEVVFQA